MQHTSHHLKNIVSLSDAFMHSVHKHYRRMGLTYVDVPQIVGITGACENVDTLFGVTSRTPVPLFFTQTGQLSLEQTLQHIPGAYTTIISGRDEECGEDERHLRQFRLTEEEFGWSMVKGTAPYDEEIMYEALLSHIEHAIRATTTYTVRTHIGVLQKYYKRNTAKLLATLEKSFLRISYDDAVTLLSKNGFPELVWGDDLKAHHEARVVELLADPEPRPVFIMRYPKEIKFFNMKVSENDPRVVLSADLILPYSGESVGSAVREHNGDRLTERLFTSPMFRIFKERGGEAEDFEWYLNIIRSGRAQPHAGYGIGNERVYQYLLGETDIRNCSLFSLLAQETHDWERKVHTKTFVQEKKVAVASI